MASYRKLGRPSDQRNAMLRGLVTEFLWNGKVVTTKARAKEVQKIAEKFITRAIKEYDNTVTVKKNIMGVDGKLTATEIKNDAPSKLHARRLMMAYLYDKQEPKAKDESRIEYQDRTAAAKHPLVEKIFREYGPKYAQRAKDKGQGGGYTRIIKIGQRRGDATEIVLLELV